MYLFLPSYQNEIILMRLLQVDLKNIIKIRLIYFIICLYNLIFTLYFDVY